MTVELICVGTELLLGNIVNTNAAFIAEQCAALGLSMYHQSVVGDNEERLSESIQAALSRSDIIILNGGLGPTKDDLTKESAARVLGRALKEEAHTKERIRDYFSALGKKEITENNWKQALVPEGALVVDNQNGTAPGLIMQEGEKHIILLPGPPNELLPMFKTDIVPYLNELQPGIITSQMVKICGVGESAAETMILDLIENQSNPTIAPYAKTGEVHLRITAKAESEKEGKKLIKPVVKELKARFGMNIYTTDESVTLENAVVDLLIKNKLSIATAESCTAGMLAARLANVPGVSETLKTGFITYANKSKRKFLGVKKTTLDKYGAVSQETAREMVKGTIFFTKADVAVAITGIAGPGGGTEEKPVGLVYIACQVCGTIAIQEYHFGGNREKVREQTVVAALTLLRSCILEYYSKKHFGKEE